MPRTRNKQRVLSIPFRLACCALASIAWAVSAGAVPEGATSSWADVPHEGSEREALEAIARHPEALREAAMRVAAQPELIVRIEGIRAWSSRGFEEILEGHDDADRADLWEMIRYPEVVEAIVEGNVPEDLEEILAGTPADVKEAALRAVRNSPKTLEKIDALHQETHAAFGDVLGDVEPELADALESVASEPALLSVLAENLELTVALGEAYEREPEVLRAWLADLSVQVAAADDRERDEWSEAIREDEALREQVVESAAAWEDESGARQDAYDEGYDDGYERGYADDRAHLSHVRPYPYWYGYPAFRADIFVPAAHTHTLWYPRSHWGHLGFRYGPGHSLIVFSAPSFPFLYWLRVRQPHHHYVRGYPHHQRVRHIQHTKVIRRAHHAHHYRTGRIHDSRREIQLGGERQRVKRSQVRNDNRRRHARLRLDDSQKPRPGRNVERHQPKTERRRSAKAKPKTERRRSAKAKPRTDRKRTAKAKPRKPRTDRKRTAKAKPRTDRKRTAKAKPRTDRKRTAKAKPKTDRKRGAKSAGKADRAGRRARRVARR
ncbi:MAG: hypothetical protein JRH01_12950 [Deltaproteobacteria bacterium]|nr:hypothetical protein [Deltaproteobacteria bacterium]